MIFSMFLIYLTFYHLKMIQLSTHEDTKLLCEHANNEQDKLQNWLSLDELSININKINYILFFSKKGKQDCELILSDVKIKKVLSTKSMGLHIDHKLA